MFATAGGEEPLRLECEGFRERRDAGPARPALTLATAVREDGVARTTGPLNAYERRVVHVALSQVEGVVTYSVGEGSDRRVTVAPAPPRGEPRRPASPGPHAAPLPRSGSPGAKRPGSSATSTRSRNGAPG